MRRLRRIALIGALLGFYAACIAFAEIDLARLWAGIPRLVGWLGGAFPPDYSGLDAMLTRAMETLAIATLGTTAAALMALPLAFLAARPVTPGGPAYHGVRAVLDGLRGIDAFIFALIFVAAVGLGPFAGLLGVALHSAGSIAKLWSEALESQDPGPREAALMAGGGRLKAAWHALLPDAAPQMASVVLYVWEFNVRASTVLGLVGAGGIGQELKNAVDLLDWPRVVAILSIVLVMVIAIDRLSSALRARLT